MKHVLLVLFLLVSSWAHADPSQDKITKPILEAINTGKIEKIFSLAYPPNSHYRKYFSDDEVQELDLDFKKLLRSIGNSNGYYEYIRSEIPNTFANLYYLFKFDRQPALVVLQLYKPKNEWHIHSLAIDTDIDDYMETSAENRIGSLGLEDIRLGLKAKKAN